MVSSVFIIFSIHFTSDFATITTPNHVKHIPPSDMKVEVILDIVIGAVIFSPITSCTPPLEPCGLVGTCLLVGADNIAYYSRACANLPYHYLCCQSSCTTGTCDVDEMCKIRGDDKAAKRATSLRATSNGVREGLTNCCNLHYQYPQGPPL